MAYVLDEDKETLQVNKLLVFSYCIFSFITHTLSLFQALLSAVVFKLRYDESYNFLNPVRREGREGREGGREGGREERERGGREEI